MAKLDEKILYLRYTNISKIPQGFFLIDQSQKDLEGYAPYLLMFYTWK